MALTDWILLATIGAILWYSWETRGMKKEMVKQTELRIRPQIIAYLDKKGQNFLIMNVGNGTAMNVMVDELLLDAIEQRVKLVFDRIDAIMPGQERKIIHSAYGRNNRKIEADFPFIANLDPQWASQTYHLNITYDNIEGIKYSSKVQCGKAGIKLLETKKLSK